jgi:ureidoglycolate amidohydrolase
LANESKSLLQNLAVDHDRLQSEIDELATFSSDEAHAVTRVVFSEQDRHARAWLKELCGNAGLAVREDAVGNMFARWTGALPLLPVVGTGSHIDAIPHAGKYDGVVGVLGGLEAIRTLRRCGFEPQRSIDLILFTAEEPTRFGIGCLGSRLLSGTLAPACDNTLEDSEGRTLSTLRESAGFLGPLESVALAQNAYAAFVELHIEQGEILEREGIALGIVSNIAAPASLRIFIQGEGGHAGGRLMPGRRDALCAASEIILAVEQAALATGAEDTVATVGICNVHPGAVNSIPSRVELTVDLRDTDEARREQVRQRIESNSAAIAIRRNVDVQVRAINADAPAACSPDIIAALKAACEQESLPWKKMVSRAYHDTLFMAHITPVGMLFIPCRDGVSHRPDEFADMQDIVKGVRVLAITLAVLSDNTS